MGLRSMLTHLDLARFRSHMGMTQAEMANELGLSLRAYQDIEGNKSELRPIHVMAIERSSLRLAIRLGRADYALPLIRQDAFTYSRVFSTTPEEINKSVNDHRKRKTTMRDGHYITVFHVNGNVGSGVATLRGGRLTGGDSQYSYIGHYSWEDEVLSATIAIKLHTSYPGGVNVFGIDEFTLDLRGRAQAAGSAEFTATTPKVPGQRMHGTLTLVAE